MAAERVVSDIQAELPLRGANCTTMVGMIGNSCTLYPCAIG